MSQVTRLPFDQYQRYRLVADLLDRLRSGREPLRVLDVGGRTGLLAGFLPRDRITAVDLEAPDDPGAERDVRLVLGDGSRLPFQTESFDVVCAHDTLEHVPVSRRRAFLEECWRATARWIVLAGPCDTPRVRRAERHLRRFMQKKLGFRHRYLQEHADHGLPVQAEIEAQLRRLGGQVQSVGHGNLERWLGLMCVTMYLDLDADLRSLAPEIYQFYNEHLYASDHAAPVYRQVVVAAFNGAPLPDLEGLFGPPQPLAPGPVARFLEELAVFDRAREGWWEERERFQRVLADVRQDLEGHRAVLASTRQEAAARKEAMKSLRKDLAGHRRVLRESRRRLRELARSEAQQRRGREEQGEVARTLEGELAAHRAALAFEASRHEDLQGIRLQLEGERAAQREALQALERDLEGHRAALQALRAEVRDYRRSLRTVRADLSGHRKTWRSARASCGPRARRSRPWPASGSSSAL